MKMLVLLSAIALSTTAMATQDKCYETAKTAAFKYAVNEDMVTSLDEFAMQFGNENFDVKKVNGVQIEYWGFGDGSKFINVEVAYAKKKCTVKEVFMAQDDQDGHE